jgi:DNA mismatch repair protein MutL
MSMSIKILPARLANQIAAGEVVERPASVIKELIENSLDAGATAIHIVVEKGGIKKIKVSDNGQGIAKEQLTLALSRHATSKIKDLNDLEAINSLGFRGEALASISAVARLMLTSKPAEQATAWQAQAEGRDMSVNVKPAAHPNGTTIEVLDLFFNTPARRKFLRTEKTEFHHIDEVVKRIALAHFNVGFTLTHNDNIVRQFRMANTKEQSAKRVAKICGTKFIEHALEIDCPHDNMKITGWLAKPSFARNQNDLCYSYVNGRMMRDKLINHAIRQAYADLLPPDTYPAFVLFLGLEHSEVDVNVHPAKHEVRFHQSRYVHDFIYSVCHKALTSALSTDSLLASSTVDEASQQSTFLTTQRLESKIQEPLLADLMSDSQRRPDYIRPLQNVTNITQQKLDSASYASSQGSFASKVYPKSSANYERLMTVSDYDSSPNYSATNKEPDAVSNGPIPSNIKNKVTVELLSIYQPGYVLYRDKSSVRVLSLFSLAQNTYESQVKHSWTLGGEVLSDNNEGLVSQPLLLPVMLTLSEQLLRITLDEQALLHKAGIVFVPQNKNKIQIRQFPALLRECDVSKAFNCIVEVFYQKKCIEEQTVIEENDIFQAIAAALVKSVYDEACTDNLLELADKLFKEQLSQQLTLNSVPLDLTSHIEQFS